MHGNISSAETPNQPEKSEKKLAGVFYYYICSHRCYRNLIAYFKVRSIKRRNGSMFKKIKKVVAFALALTMLMGMSTVAFAVWS